MSSARPNGETTEKAIRQAAIKVIARHGFEAASLRMIAKEVGLQAPSMYNYIKSKEQLLFDLLKGPVSAMTAEYEERAKALPDPFERLSLFIEVHLDFHLDFTQEVFIGNMELRNLSKPHYKIITGLRDRYSMLLTRIIEDGVAEGKFRVEDPRVTTFALLAMLSGVCNWYRPDGPQAKEDLIRIHTRLALQMLGLGSAAEEAVPALPRKTVRAPAGGG